MSEFEFFFPLKVRHADTDAQGHVFFGNYLTFFDEGVTGYLDAIGFTARNLIEIGLDFFYVAAQCQYKDSARSGELLQIGVRVTRIGNSSISFDCAVFRQSDVLPRVDPWLVSGSVTAVLVNPATRKPQRVPEEFRLAVRQLQGEGA